MKKWISLLLAICLLCCLGNMALAADSDFAYEVTDDGNGNTVVNIYEYLGNDTHVVIPDTIEGYPVRSVGMEGNENITEITIRGGVSEIYPMSFGGCTNLTTLHLPTSLQAIGQDAFRYCPKLSTITMAQSNDGTFSVSDNVLYAWVYSEHHQAYITEMVLYPSGKTDEDFTVPAGVFQIGSRAMAMNDYVKTIRLPESMYRICEFAFVDCDNLTALVSEADQIDMETDDAGRYWDILGVLHTTEDEYYYKAAPGFVIYANWGSTLQQYGAEKTITVKELTDAPEKESHLIASVTYADGSPLADDVGVRVYQYIEESVPEFVVKALEGKEFLAMDIALLKEGEVIQPDGTLKVVLNVPEGYDPATLSVVHVAEDGTVTDMNAKYENGELYFLTDHFSAYAIVKSEGVRGDVNGDGTTNAVDALMALQSAVDKLTLTQSQFAAADLDKNGEVDAKDALIMLKIAVGKE